MLIIQQRNNSAVCVWFSTLRYELLEGKGGCLNHLCNASDNHGAYRKSSVITCKLSQSLIRQGFSTRGNFALQGRFGDVKRHFGHGRYLLGRSQQCYKTSSNAQGTDNIHMLINTAKNYPNPNVNRAEGEKPCSRSDPIHAVACQPHAKPCFSY